MRNLSLAQAARAYAERGWPVFPCIPRTKRPAVKSETKGEGGYKLATTDPATIERWWNQWPQANIGIPTGRPDTFDALDSDGAEGDATLAALEAKHGKLQSTPWQRTPGAKKGPGRHLLFRGCTLPTTVKNAPGLDTRGVAKSNGAGGYILVAPSVHPSGGIYEIHDLDIPLTDPPPWLIEAIISGRYEHDSRSTTPTAPAAAVVPGTESAVRTLLCLLDVPLEPIGEHERNDRLTSIAGGLRRRGMDTESINRVLEIANIELCYEPLDAAEVRGVAESVGSYPGGQRAADICEGWLREHYVPQFRDGQAMWSRSLGRFITPRDLVPTKDAVDRLAVAVEVKRDRKGRVNMNALVNAWNSWIRPAYGTTLGTLPLEEDAPAPSSVAPFLLDLARVMTAQHTMGERVAATTVLTERRGLLAWVVKFTQHAPPERWIRLRSLDLWAWRNAERLLVALRPALAHQVQVQDRPLAGIDLERLGRLARAYHIHAAPEGPDVIRDGDRDVPAIQLGAEYIASLHPPELYEVEALPGPPRRTA